MGQSSAAESPRKNSNQELTVPAWPRTFEVANMTANTSAIATYGENFYLLIAGALVAGLLTSATPFFGRSTSGLFHHVSDCYR